MKTRLMAVAVTVALIPAIAAWGAPSASADTGTPLDCAGVVAVPGGYQLTQEAVCSLNWIGNDEFFDLGGHTLTGGLRPRGHNQVVRNGTLLPGRGDDWSMASDFTASYVAIRPAPSTSWLGIFIEAGSNLTVDHSTFENIPGAALDFFFFEGGTVRDSVFRGNGTGISIQKSTDVLIENSSFIDNGRGVNLWPEDHYGVDRTTIKHNMFRGNGYGVTIHDDGPGFLPTGLQDNLIARNQFQASGHSGIAITKQCRNSISSVQCLDSSGNVIRDNHFTKSGFETPAEVPNDDGITARGIFSGNPSVSYPAALVGFTLSGNRADRNADLGFDVLGVTDGGGNSAKFNGNRTQCEGLVCRVPRGAVRQDLGAGNTLTEFTHQ